MIYVLTGPNWFEIKRRLEELKTEYIEKNGELSIENIDGEEANWEQILSALESMPFLSSGKTVIINRLAGNKSITEKIDELLGRVVESTNLVLVEPQIDRRGTYYKALKKLKGFEEYSEPDDMGTINWLIEQAKQKNGQLTTNDARYVVELAGINQQKLSGELEKLLAYDSKITKQTIELLVEPTPQSSIFSLLDAAFARDLNSTLRLYDDQRAQGVEPLNILGMMAWQLHGVALMQAAKTKNVDQVSRDSGLKPFVLQKSGRIASRLDKKDLQKLIDDLLDLDIKFKTTAIDQDTALKNLLASLV